MKTCQPHGYNPPSRCPNCRIKRAKNRSHGAKAGHETRRKNNEARHLAKTAERRKKLANHGWLS